VRAGFAFLLESPYHLLFVICGIPLPQEENFYVTG